MLLYSTLPAAYDNCAGNLHALSSTHFPPYTLSKNSRIKLFSCKEEVLGTGYGQADGQSILNFLLMESDLRVVTYIHTDLLGDLSYCLIYAGSLNKSSSKTQTVLYQSTEQVPALY